MRFLILLAAGCGSASLSPLAESSLDSHNTVRDPLGLEPLTWDESLADVAQSWSDHLSADEGCALIHDGSLGLGENLYWSSQALEIGEAIEAWASEVVFYDLESNTCDPGQMCGHYTQIVWASTARVGCAMAPCGGGGTVAMCSYDPPGNWIGERPY